ncbi:hypothetical protein AVDCRST_MAG94-3514, partial [uncultured Leptolyngbya sp.]
DFICSRKLQILRIHFHRNWGVGFNQEGI